MAKFSEALDRKMEEIERPAVLPKGHYIAQIDKLPDQEEFTSSKNGKTYDRVTFMLTVSSASEDVDEDELSDFGKIAGYKLRKVFLFSQDEEDQNNFDRTMFDMRQFLEAAGAPAKGALSDALSAAVNGQVLVEANHRPDPNNPEIIYVEAGRCAPAD